MRTTYYLLPLAALLAAAGTTAAQTAGTDAPAPASPMMPPPGASWAPMDPQSLAPSQLQAAPGGTMVDLQTCSKGPFCNKLWVDVEYLGWWTKSNSLPPLLTQGSTSDLSPGALGQQGTSVLYGGSIDSGFRSGIRVGGGYWFGDDHICGIDDCGFILAPRTTTFTANSGNNTLLAVPYNDVLLNKPAATVLAYPGLSQGTFTASVKDIVWGGDTNLRLAVCRVSWIQACLLAGVRYLQVNESLGMTTDVPGADGQGAAVVANSAFTTRNEFYGGNVGGHVSLFYSGWCLDLKGKVAFGETFESANIGGNTQVNVPGANPTTFPAGPLALPSNIGHYSRNVFAIVPEGALNLGYQFNQYFRVTLGYTFLSINHVLRPGDLVDTGVNTTVVGNALLKTPVVGVSRPTFPGTDSDFWVQGVSAGVEIRY